MVYLSTDGAMTAAKHHGANGRCVGPVGSAWRASGRVEGTVPSWDFPSE